MNHSNLEVFPEEEKLVAELGLLGIRYLSRQSPYQAEKVRPPGDATGRPGMTTQCPRPRGRDQGKPVTSPLHPAQPCREARPIPRVGRSQPCPCGSGKKYKHCHGRRVK